MRKKYSILVFLGKWKKVKNLIFYIIIYNTLMTTITIDNISETKIKTKFATPLEAGYYLIGLSMKTSKSTRKNTKFEIAMEEYRNGESVDGKEFLSKLIASKSE